MMILSSSTDLKLNCKDLVPKSNRKAKDYRTRLLCAFSGCVPLGCSGSGYMYIYILDLDHGASNDESILDKESLVSWMTDDPSDPGSLILIGILPKKSILSQRGNFLCRCQPMEEVIFSCFKNQEQNQSN